MFMIYVYFVYTFVVTSKSMAEKESMVLVFILFTQRFYVTIPTDHEAFIVGFE